MEAFRVGKYLVKMLDKDNKNELLEVQKLRYQSLLREFNPSLPEDGIDDDGFDQYSDSILIIDEEKNKIVGTYRFTTVEGLKGNKFKSEEEFNIDALKNSGYKILETGRACVDKEYRDGNAIGLLWKGLFRYIDEHGVRFTFGTCSFEGTDPHKYDDLFAYLGHNLVNKTYNVYATRNSFEYPSYEKKLEEITIPNLFHGYMRLGATLSTNGFIDYEFKSIDLMIIMDTETIDPRYKRHYLR